MVFIAGTLATDIWRVIGVFAALRVDEGSEVFLFARAISTALVAALIARIVCFPPGALADAPLVLRLGAFATGLAVYFAMRRSMALGIVAGEVVLVGGFALVTYL
ncbi:MAG TPA: AzlD domain-containing protein [Hyphomicrobiales bacterium]|nr:AzlD domain-containing protein [Hyphomicrobiales bacterium]